MRIVLDLQGAQTASRFRGIGRCTLSLVLAIARHRGHHEVMVALNGAFKDTIEPIRAAFDNVLQQDKILVWYGLDLIDDKSPWKRDVAKRMREAFLLSLAPDVVHILSFFEYGSNAITSIGQFYASVPTVFTLYDLIPLLNSHEYLKPDPAYEKYYLNQIEQCKKATAFLAISNSSLNEGVDFLGFDRERAFNISAGCDPIFKKQTIMAEEAAHIRRRFHIKKSFIMYSSATDPRKNHLRLMAAYASLSDALRQTYQLVFVGGLPDDTKKQLIQCAKSHGLTQESGLIMTGRVTDHEMMILYNLCHLFVFPSWHEGFGLPLLEAMSCGAAVIGSNTSSVPEVIGCDAALFDPYDVKSIAQKITEVLTNDAFHASLVKHSLHQAIRFSWDKSALKAIDAYEKVYANHRATLLPKSVSIELDDKPTLFFVTECNDLQEDPQVSLLLAALERHYVVEYVGTGSVGRSLKKKNQVVHDANWLLNNAHPLDRVIYCFCGSSYSESLISLIEAVPGAVIFGDVTEINIVAEKGLARSLYAAHGYSALDSCLGHEGMLDGDIVKSKYPFNLYVLQRAQGVIVPNDTTLQRTIQCYGASFCRDWIVISQLLDSDNLGELAKQYHYAIETCYMKTQHGVDGLIHSIANVLPPLKDSEYLQLACLINHNQPVKSVFRQLFVDISELVCRDSKTGIQRVTRSVLKALVNNPPMGYRIEPVYADKKGPYQYAREFMFNFLGYSSEGVIDELISFRAGDLFLGLDLQRHVVCNKKNDLNDLRRSGVHIYFVVYDLLPIFLADKFGKNDGHHHSEWLRTISEFDGALCISRAVADELYDWLHGDVRCLKRFRPYNIGYFHLGADIENSVPTTGFPHDAEKMLDELAREPSFLMVSTIDPRKGYEQVLAAFEELWRASLAVKLVIVGKNGWMMDHFIKKIKTHREFGRRLIWLDGISDEYLEKIYAASRCLIVASEGEGFGLSLIEAARYKMPIIARDLPVFREIAHNHATFFSGLQPTTLAETIKTWLIDFSDKQHIKSDDMPWLTWEESTQQLLNVMLKGQWYRTLQPNHAMGDG